MNRNRNRHIANERKRTRRRAALKRSGHTMIEVARLAGVSFRFVQYWYSGERRSERVAEAHFRLTSTKVDSAAEQAPIEETP